ncbi:hypothetical protein CDL15_Pgr013940 [Punica granatum]|uniref:Uncharacterized protein n=1 Tax=Punica granatum TaxID=22663 RepID=A0A218WAG8_PUNGR|nr:hypothetical protein CDL15_Pgr013940 [Punica granatum]
MIGMGELFSCCQGAVPEWKLPGRALMIGWSFSTRETERKDMSRAGGGQHARRWRSYGKIWSVMVMLSRAENEEGNKRKMAGMRVFRRSRDQRRKRRGDGEGDNSGIARIAWGRRERKKKKDKWKGKKRQVVSGGSREGKERG